MISLDIPGHTQERNHSSVIFVITDSVSMLVSLDGIQTFRDRTFRDGTFRDRHFVTRLFVTETFRDKMGTYQPYNFL